MKFLVPVLLLLSSWCFADVVVTAEKVENNVNIRMSPDASSEVVGRLNKGEKLRLVESTEGWNEVEIEGGATGFISADWSRVISDEAVEESVAEVLEELIPEESAGAHSATEPVAETVAAIEVEVEVEEVIETEIEAVAEVPAAENTEPVAETLEAAPEADVTPQAPEVVAVPEPAPEPEPVVHREPSKAGASLKGKPDYLVRFKSESEGIRSQVFDNGNRVGIGTTEPQQRLEVNGSIQIHEQNSSVAGLMITQSSGDTGYIMHNRANTLTIGAGSQDRITIDRDGNVGIGVSRLEFPLQMASGAHVTAGGVWTNRSSRSSKENIAVLPIADALAAFNGLTPVSYNYKNEASEQYVGFIAEDVPDLVAMQDRESLSTMDIVAVLTAVVQEQQRRIDALEARLAEDKR
ncbi:MAG: SH3 domain-containing protein [Gammaproteobacteria bacterium]|nr:SH3 domain-containing protein [Gammaproteobacteria bacterium]